MKIKDIISSGLLELYITGLTSNEETIEVEEWAKQYPEVETEIVELQNVMEKYALAEAISPDDKLKEKILSKIQPDNSVKDKIFSRIQPTSSAQTANSEISILQNEKEKVYSIPLYYKYAIAASIALLLGSLLFNYILYNKNQSSDNKFQAINKQYDSIYNIHKSDSNALLAAHEQLENKKIDDNSVSKNTPQKQNKDVAVKEQKPKENFEKINQDHQNTESINNYVNIAGDKYSVPVVLKGTKAAPDALAKIFWMKNNGDVYVDATYLPQPPDGKQYQLWAIVDGQPVDAGMITTPKGNFKIQKMKSFGSAEAFAITLENSGGSPAPNMKAMVVKAKI